MGEIGKWQTSHDMSLSGRRTDVVFAATRGGERGWQIYAIYCRRPARRDPVAFARAACPSRAAMGGNFIVDPSGRIVTST